MPNAAYERFLSEAGPRSAAQSLWTAADGPLPALYLSHGAPPLLDDAGWMRQLNAWALSMPKPRGILVVSAHWEAAPVAVTAPAAATPLVYDFHGFEERYYRMTYPSPDAGDLTRRVVAALPERVHEHPDRGLDHGAWVPLKAMYPLADVPVVQLSMPTLAAEPLLDVGRRLRALRDEGVLVVGSGFMTHGLPFLTREIIGGAVPEPAWSVDFDAWAADALRRNDLDALADFRTKAPGMPYAHPTVEHFSPLFVALGASGTGAERARSVIDGYWWGLSKRSFQVA